MGSSVSIVPGRRERQKLDREKRILAAARRLFDRRGYLNTSMEDVARRAGLAVGTLSALAAARAASTLLFGLQPHDPATFITAGASLAAVAALASYLPAVRASRLEPTEALREE